MSTPTTSNPARWYPTAAPPAPQNRSSSVGLKRSPRGREGQRPGGGGPDRARRSGAASVQLPPLASRLDRFWTSRRPVALSPPVVACRCLSPYEARNPLLGAGFWRCVSATVVACRDRAALVRAQYRPPRGRAESPANRGLLAL